MLNSLLCIRQHVWTLNRIIMVIMLSRTVLCWLIGGLMIGPSWGSPVPESLPLSLVSDLTSRLGKRPSRLQEGRLPLPPTPDLETIKKVAQILVMLGQQVIPAIIGDPQSSPVPGEPLPAGEEIPNDPVTLDKQLIAS